MNKHLSPSAPRTTSRIELTLRRHSLRTLDLGELALAAAGATGVSGGMISRTQPTGCKGQFER